MKKKLLNLAFITFLSASSFAQVGINTDSPLTTLDVVKSSNLSVPDGIQAPRLSYTELAAKNDAYQSSQVGALVYVTEGPAANVTPVGKVVNVRTTGYYYFDGEIWRVAAIEPWNRATTDSTTHEEPATLNTQNIYQMGYVGIGEKRPVRALHIKGSGGASDDILVESNSGNGGSAGQLALRRSRVSATTPSIVLNGDRIGDILFSAYNGTSYADRAGIRAEVKGTVTTTSQPTDLVFLTGTNNFAERMRVLSDGRVQVSNLANPDNRVVVADATGVLKLQDIVTAPPNSFLNNSTLSAQKTVKIYEGGCFKPSNSNSSCEITLTHYSSCDGFNTPIQTSVSVVNKLVLTTGAFGEVWEVKYVDNIGINNDRLNITSVTAPANTAIRRYEGAGWFEGPCQADLKVTVNQTTGNIKLESIKRSMFTHLVYVNRVAANE